jgi:glycosyltransferase involved in cell wall biosynthesis
MRIAVNAACLCQDSPADTGHIATEILLRLCRQHPEHTFILFTDRAFPASLSFPANVTIVLLTGKGSAAWRRYWWMEWKLPKAMKAHGAEVFLGMDGMLPLRSKIPAVLFVKNSAFLHQVTGEVPSIQRFLSKNMQRYMAFAKQVVVLSAAVQEELRQYAPDLAAKLCLLPVGISESYRVLEWEERESVKQQYAGGVEYFIVPGSLHPRNNIVPLLKAFSALKRRQRSNIKLVLVGSATLTGQEIATSLQTYKFRNDVVWIKEADQPTLALLVGAAYALIYTARFDGLALPIYTALRCQVPVIALESAVAREAGGDAILYADPANLDDLAEKMKLLYKDEQLRSRLLAKAPAPATFDSWDGAARQLWDCITIP